MENYKLLYSRTGKGLPVPAWARMSGSARERAQQEPADRYEWPTKPEKPREACAQPEDGHRFAHASASRARNPNTPQRRARKAEAAQAEPRPQWKKPVGPNTELSLASGGRPLCA